MLLRSQNCCFIVKEAEHRSLVEISIDCKVIQLVAPIERQPSSRAYDVPLAAASFRPCLQNSFMVFCDQESRGDKDTGDDENPNRKDYERASTASSGLSFRCP